MWFRRDLRVTDHPALTAAAAADLLVCVFVTDPRLVTGPRTAPARIVYLRQTLADLAAALADRGNRLVVLDGDPEEVIPSVVARTDAVAVHVSADHTPFAVARDRAVAAALADGDVAFESHSGVTIVPPGSVLTASGDTYKVFTPFHRSWGEVDHGQPLPAPDNLPPSDGTDGLAVSEEEWLRAEGPEIAWPHGGETAARARLDTWLADGVDDYDDSRDLLAVDGTSRLSPDLHFGCLSAREVHQRLDRRNQGQQTFGTELAWRDFYLHVMARWPAAARTAFRPDYRDLPWHDDPEGLAAWQDGLTGYPVVDAAMRQLQTTGWMHNRARMITASFLCKDLLIDWRLGEAHFLRHLVDGDVASNNGGWQWAAGTGTDAQPFFRIFNPVTQGRRFDPDGDYVRRYVPELRAVPAPAIHTPWTLTVEEQEACGVTLGRDYPMPIVDHAEARDRALAWFEHHRR